MARTIFSVTSAKKLSRQEKKERAALIRQLQRDSEQTKRDRNAEKLPPAAGGPLGVGARAGQYWNLFRLNQAAHQSTSENIAGIYPFVADSGLGHRGPIVGIDMNADVLWHFSPWDLYMDTTLRAVLSTNILVLGAYRAGKSGVIKMLTTRSIAFGHQVVVPSDSKGEWVKVAQSVGGQVIEPGLGQRLNPLDRGPRRTGVTDDEHEAMVAARRETALTSLVEATIKGQKPLNPMEHGAITWALNQAIAGTDDDPTLTDVYNQLISIDPTASSTDAKRHANSERVTSVLERFVHGGLKGLFERRSTAVFDEDAPMVVVNTSELFGRGELVAQLTQICTSAWIQAVISDRAAKRTRYLVREEGWRDMASLSALQTLQQWLKLSRHYGIANIIILHKFSDFDAVGDKDSVERALAYSIAADIENKFIFRVNAQEQDNLVDRLKMPPAHAAAARSLKSGNFIAYVGMYSYTVDAFETSTEWEKELFKTDDAMEAGSGLDILPHIDPVIDAPKASFAAQFDQAELERLWPTPVGHGYRPVSDWPREQEQSA